MRNVWTDVPLTPAQWDELAATPTGVFLSRRTAAQLGLRKGDALPILTRRPLRDDGSRLWPLTVLGVVADRPLDRGGLLMGNYAYYDGSNPHAERGAVGQFQILIRDPARADQTASAIDALFANSPNPTYSIPEKTLTESGTRYQFNIPLITQMVAGAGLFMILFLTGNGIAQSVRERIPEFAVLKTLGFSDTGVMALVFAEAAIPCLLGAAIGLAIATAIARLWLPGIVMPLTVGVALPTLSPAILAIGFAFAALVAFAGAVIPALRIKWLDVATALRR
jgi:putative ABC transport system permease protein